MVDHTVHQFIRVNLRMETSLAGCLLLSRDHAKFSWQLAAASCLAPIFDEPAIWLEPKVGVQCFELLGDNCVGTGTGRIEFFWTYLLQILQKTASGRSAIWRGWHHTPRYQRIVRGRATFWSEPDPCNAVFHSTLTSFDWNRICQQSRNRLALLHPMD